MCRTGDRSGPLGQTARMTNRAPRPPTNSPFSMNLSTETLRVQQGFTFWKTYSLGATLQTHDATGSRITFTRAATIGLFALGMRKKTGQLVVIVTGRDGSMTTVKVDAKKADKLLTWAFEFTVWNEAEHRNLGLPYPPI